MRFRIAATSAYVTPTLIVLGVTPCCDGALAPVVVVASSTPKLQTRNTAKAAKVLRMGFLSSFEL
jgi:hypothetical protein